MNMYRSNRPIPNHMLEAVKIWVEQGLPSPESMGHFFRSVLSNKLVDALSYADEYNRAALETWAQLLYNDIPGAAWGSAEKLEAWYRFHREVSKKEENAKALLAGEADYPDNGCGPSVEEMQAAFRSRLYADPSDDGLSPARPSSDVKEPPK